MKTALGKATSTTNAMPASFHPSVARKVSRFCADSQSTIEPRKPNMPTSTSAMAVLNIAAIAI